MRKAHSLLRFSVAEDHSENEVYERLDIEARTLSGTRTQLTFWEDGIAWIWFCQNERDRAQSFEIHANLRTLNTEQVADLIRETLADFESVRHIWEEYA